ncbi:hypothetical protein AG1IA_09909 [Rhizoctonia solani AG-1 IA]|uniref:Uncharacterized protein n=1 Tax=Thanatephorus cucumeris (strain AG1-IA) TaxID=983506 RepID=L8WDL9_THACA|nr:hypothetical protein AG1IA_09909 [Rhizoctonia solani AG-1 IA]
MPGCRYPAPRVQLSGSRVQIWRKLRELYKYSVAVVLHTVKTAMVVVH